MQSPEEHFKKMIESSQDLFWELDENANFTYVSPTIKNLLGYDPEDVIGTNAFDLMNSDEAQRVHGKFDPIEKKYLPFNNLINTNLHKDGHEVIIESSGTPIFDNEKKFCGYFGIDRDITERMKSEGKIRESEEKFRTLTELSHVGIFLTDAEGNAIYINSRCAEIVGVPVDEALCLDWVQYLHPDDCDRVVNEWLKTVENKNSFQQEYRYIHTDGQIVWTRGEATPVWNSQEEVSFFIGTMVDITLLKESEAHQELLTRRLEALWKISRLKNADFKTICDTALDEITQMTGSSYGFYGFLDATETAMTIHSWSSHTMADCAIHKKPLVFTIEESGVWGNAVRDRKPFLLNDYREACANKTGLPEGHVGLTRVLAVPVFDNDKIVALAAVANKPTAYTDQDLQQLDVFLSNVQIIIDQKRAEDEKIDLEMQLHQAQKIESIGQLAGGVAHDFNNMLGVIIGHAELALRKADPDNPFIGDLEEIRTAALRSADLTRQLLTFARKEAITPKTLDLNDTVSGMLKLLQRLIGENIHLSWNPGTNLWATRIDPSQLDQILANLCVNARDAIAGIGKIVIETQNCPIAEGGLKADPEAQPGDYVCLSISDDGHGVDPGDLDQIFEPFFTTKEFGHGTGLGLATVFGAVKQNHGFIDVISEPGQGTTFHIYLPRKQAKIKSVEEVTSQPLSQGEETILLVEDDQMLLELTKTMLEESGYTILDASTSDRAISFAKDHPEPIHLLLSDLVMPEMNGKELRDRLLVIRPAMKVIFMSGYTADIIAQQGEIEEGTHFLQKPVSLEELTAKVRKVLDQD